MTQEELQDFILNVQVRNPGKFTFDFMGGYLSFAYDPTATGTQAERHLILIPTEEETYEHFHQRFWDTVFPRPG